MLERSGIVKSMTFTDAAGGRPQLMLGLVIGAVGGMVAYLATVLVTAHFYGI